MTDVEPRYQLFASLPHGFWFRVSDPIGWEELLDRVRLRRRFSPYLWLRAVRWEERDDPPLTGPRWWKPPEELRWKLSEEHKGNDGVPRIVFTGRGRVEFVQVDPLEEDK